MGGAIVDRGWIGVGEPRKKVPGGQRQRPCRAAEATHAATAHHAARAAAAGAAGLARLSELHHRLVCLGVGETHDPEELGAAAALVLVHLDRLLLLLEHLPTHHVTRTCTCAYMCTQNHNV